MEKKLKKTANEIHYKKQAIDTVINQLSSLKSHSFGFGTSFYDIDEHLRPLAESFLRSKLMKLEMELEGLLKKH